MMQTKRNTFLMILAIAAGMACLECCAVRQKLARIRSNIPTARTALSHGTSLPADIPESDSGKDTLIIRSFDGRDMIVMRAIRDDNGQMVANQVLEAAKVTARFRNTAERRGRVILEFQIIVPASLRESQWQLRYQPTLFLLGDSVKLDKVLITGDGYRRQQMRGYQQYERFLRRIISDSTHFINTAALEIFLRRNIPELYAFKTDTNFVTDEAFYSLFGVSQQEAVRHYTDSFALARNKRLNDSRHERFKRYVKAPIATDGVRLDTILVNEEGDFIYNYVQSVETRPLLKKAVITVDGQIYEQDRLLCLIGRSEPLDFYISSVSAFVDNSDRFVTKIIERNIRSDCSYRIDFGPGSSRVDLSTGENAVMIKEICNTLRGLMTNETFCLDSITVTSFASPEGRFSFNRSLSDRRSKAICAYFEKYLASLKDSLNAEKGFDVMVDESMSGKVVRRQDGTSGQISFISKSAGENWGKLDRIVEEEFDDIIKERYFELAAWKDPDKREDAMKKTPWYADIKSRIYPRLRCVEFNFHLHRKGMVKDTVTTTQLDTVYMSGVQAIMDRDYKRAIEILRPYQDFNTAVAYCAGDFNHSALAILEKCPRTAPVNYMSALIYSRLGDVEKAIELFLRSCSQDEKFIYRGNLDPEISVLIRKYDLQKQLQKDNFTY